MEITLFSVLALGFLLGIRHAIEPDHVIAVSTIASQSKKLSHASLAGIYWGIGHTATLFIMGIILILMKNDLSTKWSLSLEFLVGIMLVYLGITSVLSFRKDRNHSHHVHPDYSEKAFSTLHQANPKVSFLKSFTIGLIHGLAGSAAMVLLTMSTVNSVWQGGLYILVFGTGTITGMLLFTTIIGIPFVLSMKQRKPSRVLRFTTGSISTIFGIYYMYNLGFNEGLFKLWV
jgi:sulfite exporter TauE/SafE